MTSESHITACTSGKTSGSNGMSKADPVGGGKGGVHASSLPRAPEKKEAEKKRKK